MSTYEERASIGETVSLFLNGPDLLTLSRVHGHVRRAMAEFISNVHSLQAIPDARQRLSFAVRTGKRELCELVRIWGTRGSEDSLMGQLGLGGWTIYDWENMLQEAAYEGHRNLCELARTWNLSEGIMHQSPEHDELFPPGATIGQPLNWHLMLHEAARGRDVDRARDLCNLACAWILAEGQPVDWNMMLAGAAAGGHRDLCHLAVHRMLSDGSEPDYNEMLIEATNGSDPVRARELCELAREWHAKQHEPAPLNYNGMLLTAAEKGHLELCHLAREWAHETPNYNDMLLCATRGGHRNICELARSWGLSLWDDRSPLGTAAHQAMDWDLMLHDAAFGGNRELCELAREWGAKNWDSMAIGARVGGHLSLWELAQSWKGMS